MVKISPISITATDPLSAKIFLDYQYDYTVEVGDLETMFTEVIPTAVGRYATYTVELILSSSEIGKINLTNLFVNYTPPVWPSPPLGEVVDNVSSITLQWDTNPEANIEEYLLYRRAHNSTYNLSTPYAVLSGTSYLDDAVKDDVYYYVLEAVDSNGLISNLSAEIEARINYPPSGSHGNRTGRQL